MSPQQNITGYRWWIFVFLILFLKHCNWEYWILSHLTLEASPFIMTLWSGEIWSVSEIVQVCVVGSKLQHPWASMFCCAISMQRSIQLSASFASKEWYSSAMHASLAPTQPCHSTSHPCSTLESSSVSPQQNDAIASDPLEGYGRPGVYPEAQLSTCFFKNEQVKS